MYTVRSLTVLETLKTLLKTVIMCGAIAHGLDHVTELVTTDGLHHLKFVKSFIIAQNSQRRGKIRLSVT